MGPASLSSSRAAGRGRPESAARPYRRARPTGARPHAPATGLRTSPRSEELGALTGLDREGSRTGQTPGCELGGTTARLPISGSGEDQSQTSLSRSSNGRPVASPAPGSARDSLPPRSLVLPFRPPPARLRCPRAQLAHGVTPSGLCGVL